MERTPGCDANHLVALESTDRLMFLYAESNHADSETLSFWQTCLEKYCLRNCALQFRPTEVVEYFTVRGIFPSSLEPALSILMQRNCVTISSQLSKNSEQEEINYSAVGQQLLEVVSWAFGFNKIMATHDRLGELYCSYRVIELAAKAFFEFVGTVDYTERVVFAYSNVKHHDRFTFYNLVKRASKQQGAKNKDIIGVLGSMSKEESVILLHYVVNNTTNCCVSSDWSVVKLIDHSQVKDINSIRQNFKVAEVEISTLQLKNSVFLLEEQVTRMNESVEQHKQQAIEHKMSGNTGEALYQLNLKRSILRARDRLLKSLVALTAAQQQLEDGNTNADILQAYSYASSSLRAVRQEHDITADSVADAIQSFEDEMEEMRNIGIAMSSMAHDILSPDEEAAVREELNMLMAVNVEQESVVIVPTSPTQQKSSTDMLSKSINELALSASTVNPLSKKVAVDPAQQHNKDIAELCTSTSNAKHTPHVLSSTNRKLVPS